MRVRVPAELVLVVCAILLVLRVCRGAVVLGIAVAGSFAPNATIKLRRRPLPAHFPIWSTSLNHPGDNSFPSGHTVHYVVFLGFLWFP